MPFLTPEQKNSMGPLLGLFYVLLSAAGGVAVYTVVGGEPIPVISPFSAIILGVVAAFMIYKQVKE